MQNQNQNPFFDIRVEDIQTVNSNRLVPRKAIINEETDQLISVVSDRYQVIDNKTLVNDFERHLEDTDVKFRRIDCGLNRTGSRFYAKYEFPEIEVTLDTQTTNYGSTFQDNVRMGVELFNSYDASSTWGFGIFGKRLVCLNGLRINEKIYKFEIRHIGEIDEQEMQNQILLSFEAAKEMFQNNMVKTWESMLKMDYDRLKAYKILKSLELSSRYDTLMADLWKQYYREDKLKTMWDFYNMITWFSTHVVQKRNYQLSRQISAQASQKLMES